MEKDEIKHRLGQGGCDTVMWLASYSAGVHQEKATFHQKDNRSIA
jgi:hypothetical protein